MQALVTPAAKRQDRHIVDLAIVHDSRGEGPSGLLIVLVTALAKAELPSIGEASMQKLPRLAQARSLLRWTQLEAIPRNAMGKIDRQAVLARVAPPAGIEPTSGA